MRETSDSLSGHGCRNSVKYRIHSWEWLVQLAFYFVDYVDNMREFSTLFLISIAVRKTLVGGLIRVFSSVILTQYFVPLFIHLLDFTHEIFCVLFFWYL